MPIFRMNSPEGRKKGGYSDGKRMEIMTPAIERHTIREQILGSDRSKVATDGGLSITTNASDQARRHGDGSTENDKVLEKVNVPNTNASPATAIQTSDALTSQRKDAPVAEVAPSIEGSTQKRIEVGVEERLLTEFRQFAQAERLRVQERAMQDRALKIHDLRRFSRTLKLKTPVPSDLLRSVRSDANKQHVLDGENPKSLDEVSRKANDAIDDQHLSNNDQGAAAASAAHSNETNQQSNGSHRVLQKWMDDGPDALGIDHLLDSTNMTGWDQFEANKRLFGVPESTYDENIYTTPIDRTKLFYVQEEARAAKIAKEIEDNKSGNITDHKKSVQVAEDTKFSRLERVGEEIPGVLRADEQVEPENGKDSITSMNTSESRMVADALSGLETTSKATFTAITSSGMTQSTNPTSLSEQNLCQGKTRLSSMNMRQPINKESTVSNRGPQDLGSSSPSIYSSNVSTALTRLPPRGQQDIIDKFAGALAKQLSYRKPLRKSSNLSNVAFWQRVDILFDTYSHSVRHNGNVDREKRQTLKRVHGLRRQICDQFMSEMLEDYHHLPNIAKQAEKFNLPAKAAKDKVTDWYLAIDEDNNSTTWDIEYSIAKVTSQVEQEGTLLDEDVESSSEALSSSPSEDGQFYAFRGSTKYVHFTEAKDNDIYNFLTSHTAFLGLASNLETLIELSYSDKMELIKQRLSAAFRRQPYQKSSSDHQHSACFRIRGWDIKALLNKQYSDRLSQDLGSILAVTGTGQTDQAYLSTVREYFRFAWPGVPGALLAALQSAVSTNEDKPALRCLVYVSLVDQEVSVTGSEDFIVAIAQQLTWLVTSCRASSGGLAHSLASFRELSAPQHEARPEFSISAETVPLDSEESQDCCWHPLIGNTVIATGFPIPDRYLDERGLELPLEIMAYLGGVQIAMRYERGYVLKGRSIMFIPVERKYNTMWNQMDSVQWHLVHKPGRMRYQDVISLCPDRLDANALPEEDISTTRAFLGWCPSVMDNLGTMEYEYSSIKPSQTGFPPRRFINPTQATIGFSYIASGSLSFAPGRHNAPFRVSRTGILNQTLNYAQQTPVILYDTLAKRAWQTDAERAIFHLLIHRQINKQIRGAESKLHILKGAIRDDPHSIRRAMLENAEIEISAPDSDSAPVNTTRTRTFGDNVEQIFSIIEGLQDHAEQASGPGWKVRLDWSKYIQGYEYMDLLRDKREFRLKEANLKKSCGEWPAFAKVNNSVIFFGKDFGEIFQPSHRHGICTKFAAVPTGKDYLTVKGSDLHEQFFNSGFAETQLQLTASGMKWHRSPQMFEPCNANRKICKCDRIQEFVPEGAFGNVCPPSTFPNSAAFIFGQVKSRLRVASLLYNNKTLAHEEQTVPQLTHTESIKTDEPAVAIRLWSTSSNHEIHPRSSGPIYRLENLPFQQTLCGGRRNYHFSHSSVAQDCFSPDERSSEASLNYSRDSDGSFARSSATTASGIKHLTPASSIDIQLQRNSGQQSLDHRVRQVSYESCQTESLQTSDSGACDARGEHPSREKHIRDLQKGDDDVISSTQIPPVNSTQNAKGKELFQAQQQHSDNDTARTSGRVSTASDIGEYATLRSSRHADNLNPEVPIEVPNKKLDYSYGSQKGSEQPSSKGRLNFRPADDLLMFQAQQAASPACSNLDHAQTYSDQLPDLGVAAPNAIYANSAPTRIRSQPHLRRRPKFSREN